MLWLLHFLSLVYVSCRLTTNKAWVCLHVLLLNLLIGNNYLHVMITPVVACQPVLLPSIHHSFLLNPTLHPRLHPPFSHPQFDTITELFVASVYCMIKRSHGPSTWFSLVCSFRWSVVPQRRLTNKSSRSGFNVSLWLI